MTRTHLLLAALVCFVVASACAPPSAGPTDGPVGADAGAPLGVAAASLLATGDLCALHPRERRFPTWAFQDTWVRVFSYTPGHYRISLQAGAGAREYLWVNGDTWIRRYYGGWEVTVRYEGASPYNPPFDPHNAVGGCLNASTY